MPRTRSSSPWLVTAMACLLWPVLSVATQSEDTLLNAQPHFNMHEDSAAAIQLKNTLQAEPDNGKARLLLGKVYIRQWAWLSAQKELSRAWQLGVSREQVLEPLGRAYLMTGRSDELLQTITVEDGDSSPLKADILALHGQAYLSIQEYQAADDKFSEALRHDPESASALLGKAKIAAHQDMQGTGATVLIDRALSIEPDNAEAWTLKGVLLRGAGNQQQAVSAFEQALKNEPANVPARLGKAAALIRLGKEGQALAELDLVQAWFPQLHMAHYLRALALYQQQELVSAHESIQLALKLGPEHLQSLLLAGTIQFKQGSLNQAEHHLRRYLYQVPNNRQAIILLATTLLKLGTPDKAIEVMEPGVPSAANDAQYLALLGSAYMRHGDVDKGLRYLERAAAVAPDITSILSIGNMAQGDFEQGSSRLQTAIDLDQGLVQSDVLRIMGHLQNKDFDDALIAASALVEKRPNSPVPHNLQGVAFLSKRDLKAARKAFEAALRIQPDYLPAHLNMARLELLIDDVKAAKLRYEQVLSLDEGNLSAMLALAALAERNGQSEEAEQWLKKAHIQHPDAIKPALMLVERYLLQNRVTAAHDMARAITVAHPRNPAVLRALAIAQLRAGENKQASATIDTLSEVIPESPQAYYLLALMQLNQRDATAARNNLRHAIKLQDDFPEAHVALGRTDIASKDFNAALNTAGRLQQAYPDAAYGYELKGDVHAVRHEYKLAAAAYTLAHDKSSTPLLARKLFRAQLQAGEGKSARVEMRRWLVKHPEDIPVRRLLASSEISLASAALAAGQQQRAIKEYLGILEYDPDNFTALNNLAWLYLQKGKPDSVKYAERAYEQAPDRPQVIATFGLALVKNGDVERGLLLLQEAASRDPDNTGIRYHMAVALNLAGRRDEARKELNRLLKPGKPFPDRERARALRKRLRLGN